MLREHLPGALGRGKPDVENFAELCVLPRAVPHHSRGEIPSGVPVPYQRLGDVEHGTPCGNPGREVELTKVSKLIWVVQIRARGPATQQSDAEEIAPGYDRLSNRSIVEKSVRP